MVVESWKSLGLNTGRGIGSEFVPENIQSDIIQSLQKITGGWTVTNNPSVVWVSPIFMRKYTVREFSLW